MKKGGSGVAALCVVVVSFLVFGAFAFGAVRNVPGGAYPTIQSAIDASSGGDEIVVATGTYVENITFGGKNITLRSTDPMDGSVVNATIIDGTTAGSVVTFAGTEETSCVLSGFTITNGYGWNGGGILGNGTLAMIEYNNVLYNVAHGADAEGNGGGLNDCDGTIQYNLISGNTCSASSDGGGLWGCDGLIQYNTITGNIAGQDGGGLSGCNGIIQYNVICGNTGGRFAGGVYRCNGTVRKNTISENISGEGGGLVFCNGTILENLISNNTATGYSGGGLYDCSAAIQNNIISGNWANTSGGGISFCQVGALIRNNTIYGNTAHGASSGRGGGLSDCSGMIRNCIIWGNIAWTPAQLYNCAAPSYCCIENWISGGTGNFSADPQLADPVHGDFHLQATAPSPCIDAGGTVSGIDVDFEGNPRPYDARAGQRGDGSKFDIGAYEHIGVVSWNVYWGLE